MSADEGYRYEVGQPVIVVYDRNVYRDIVKRVTDASVITASQGAFRRKYMRSDGTADRREGDYRIGQTVFLFPADHPEGVRHWNRHMLERAKRSRLTVASSALTEWIENGSQGAFDLAIDRLSKAHARYGLTTGQD